MILEAKDGSHLGHVCSPAPIVFPSTLFAKRNSLAQSFHFVHEIVLLP